MRHIWIGALMALVLIAPAPALANGDPASDVLLAAKVYFPTQRVDAETAKSLNAMVDRANARGYAIRVALIRDESDLGTVPDLLNQPQKYSEFLGPEIRFAYKGDLLVVMPNGLGLTTTDESPPPMKAIEGIQVEAGGSPDGLAQTAELVIPKLAAAAGKPLEGSKGGGGGALAGIIVAAVLLLAGVAGAVWVRKSQQAGSAGAAAPAASDPPSAAPAASGPPSAAPAASDPPSAAPAASDPPSAAPAASDPGSAEPDPAPAAPDSPS